MLTVIKPVRREGKPLHWKCRCDCGKFSTVLTSNLTSGKQQSCGCYNARIRLERIEASRRSDEHKLLVHRKASLKYSRSEKGRLQRLRWTETNKDQVFARIKEWCQRNKDVGRCAVRKRRARLRGAKGEHKKSDVQRIGNSQAWLCKLCNTGIQTSYVVDHKVPLVRGGSNWPRNLQLLCRSCNSRKWKRTTGEFKKYLQRKEALNKENK